MTVSTIPHALSSNGGVGTPPSNPSGGSTRLLPLSIIELILAFSAIVNPFSPNSTPSLLMVLPRNVVPAAFGTVLISGLHWPPSINRIHFDRIISVNTPNDLMDSLAAVLLPALKRNRLARDTFVLALTRAGKLATLKRLLSNGVPLGGIERAPVDAAIGGCLNTFKWWQSLMRLPNTMLDGLHCVQAYVPVVEEAARHGHVHFLDFLLSSMQVFDWPDKGWEIASRAGQVSVLDWVKRHRYDFDCDWKVGAMDAASAQGHVHVLQWWITNWREDELEYTVRAMDMASALGHLHVLDWWSRSGLPLKFTPAAKAMALKAGHLDVVRFWLECGEYRFMSCFDSTIINPELEGHVQVPPRLKSANPATLASFGRLDWMKTACGPVLPSDDLADVFGFGSQFGHVHVLQYYLADFRNTPELRGIDAFTDQHPLLLAAAHGQLSVFQWLLAHAEPLLAPTDHAMQVLMQKASRICIQAGHVHVLDWMLSSPDVQQHLAKQDMALHALFSAAPNVLLDLFHAEGLFSEISDLVALGRVATAEVYSPNWLRVFEWCQSRQVRFGSSKWHQTHFPLAIAAQEDSLAPLDWLLGHCVDWTVDEEDVVLLIAHRHVALLGWLARHALTIRLSKQCQVRIQMFLSCRPSA